MQCTVCLWYCALTCNIVFTASIVYRIWTLYSLVEFFIVFACVQSLKRLKLTRQAAVNVRFRCQLHYDPVLPCLALVHALLPLVLLTFLHNLLQPYYHLVRSITVTLYRYNIKKSCFDVSIDIDGPTRANGWKLSYINISQFKQ